MIIVTSIISTKSSLLTLLNIGARDIPSGWDVFVKLAATACDLHNIHNLNDQEENSQYQVSQEVLENVRGLPLNTLDGSQIIWVCSRIGEIVDEKKKEKNSLRYIIGLGIDFLFLNLNNNPE